MSVYRVVWTTPDQQSAGYYDDVDKPTVQEAVWAVATARTAADGRPPVLVDVQQISAIPPSNE